MPWSGSADHGETYVILRRNGGKSGAELEAAAGRSKQVGDEELSSDIRWIHSYVVDEGDGSVGTVCVYQASSPEAIRERARRADLPAERSSRWPTRSSCARTRRRRPRSRRATGGERSDGRPRPATCIRSTGRQRLTVVS